MKISSAILALNLLCEFACEFVSADCGQSHLQSVLFYGNAVHASGVVTLDIYAL